MPLSSRQISWANPANKTSPCPWVERHLLMLCLVTFGRQSSFVRSDHKKRMTVRIAHPLRAVLAAVLLYAAGCVFSNAHAQINTNITADGTLGSRVTQAGNVFNIDGGTIRGGNQFHSFGQFSVGTGNTANFSVANTIQNIISRITGGVRSQIDGTITSTITGTSTVSSANLFLLNPAGILFGKNAQLSTGGSFHASTADYVKSRMVAFSMLIRQKQTR